MKCDHKTFTAFVTVNRLEDSGRFNADVRIQCVDCKEFFRFLGLPPGVDLNGATVSVDGEEARLAIGPREQVASMLDGDCPVGFTVRKVKPETDAPHVRTQFVERMNAELQNNMHQGDWANWKPGKNELVEDFQHHTRKLILAIAKDETDKVSEHSADVANMCDKIDELFGRR